MHQRLLEAIPLLEATIEERRAEACTGEAGKRMRGIARAYGSLRQELDDDEVRAKEQAAVYAETAETVNARYRSLNMLKAEAHALTDRLGVAAPTFSPVIMPSLREGCREASLTVDGARFVDHHHVAPATEKCEHGLRTRRTYAEVGGTPGGAILKAAGGPKPWPALTAQQQEMVESRERERQAEAVTVARFKGEAARGLQRTGLG